MKLSVLVRVGLRGNGNSSSVGDVWLKFWINHVRMSLLVKSVTFYTKKFRNKIFKFESIGAYGLNNATINRT